MKRCLPLISLLLLLFQTPCLSNDICQHEVKTADSAMTYEYHLTMQVRGHEITGICMMSQSADHGIMGTVISEFGMKAFDFIYDNGKVQLLNIVAFLDKWYIRKVLKKDLAFILSQMDECGMWNVECGMRNVEKKPRKILFKPNGEVEVINSRYKIYYSFTPMISNP